MAEAKLRRQTLEVSSEGELRAQPRLAGIAEQPATRGIGDETRERGRECRAVAFAHQNAGVVANQLGNGRDACRYAGDTLALRLSEHVRQAVAVTIARDTARQRKEVGLAIFRQQLVLREWAAPRDALADAEGARL